MTPAARRLSSRSTFYQKRILPFIVFGMLVGVPFTALLAVPRGIPFPLPVLLMPLIMGPFFWLLLRRLVFDLADEVTDEGDALRVRFGREEERIPLAEIINVSFSLYTNPQRVTLRLRHAGRFGREVSFAPPQRFLGALAGRNPLIDELIERVDAARRR